MVERSGGDVWAFVSGSGAVAGGGGESSAFEGDGSGDDVFHSAEFFLCGRDMGFVVDRMDLGQHRLGCAREEKSAGASDLRRGFGGLEG